MIGFSSKGKKYSMKAALLFICPEDLKTALVLKSIRKLLRLSLMTHRSSDDLINPVHSM